jgi:hypothetical protein
MQRIVSITRTIRKQTGSESLKRVSSILPGEKLEIRKVKLESGEEKVSAVPDPVGVNSRRGWARGEDHPTMQGTNGK